MPFDLKLVRYQRLGGRSVVFGHGDMGMNVRIVDLVLGLMSRGRGLEGSQRRSCMQWVIMSPRDGGLAHRQISRRSLGAKPNCTGRDVAADDEGGHGGMASSLVESSVRWWVWC